MSSQETIEVQLRDTVGSRNARRMRASGLTPAILYGNGEPVSLTVTTEQVEALIRHGSHVVQLKGAESGTVLVREVQWDAFGNDVLHLDFGRVAAGESVEINVSIELRGVAPGTKEGGVIQQILHELSVKCPVTAVPDKIEVNVNDLNLGDQVLVSQLEVASGVEIQADPDGVVVQCMEAGPEQEETAAVDGAEPEVIGRKEDDEGSDD